MNDCENVPLSAKSKSNFSAFSIMSSVDLSSSLSKVSSLISVDIFKSSLLQNFHEQF